MTTYGRLFRLRVMHSFNSATKPTHSIWPRPVEPATLARHRLVVRSGPGTLQVGVPLGSDGRPRFGLPRRVDLALIAKDATIDSVTHWSPALVAKRPDGLRGVARQALPMYRGHFGSGPFATLVEPLAEPAFVEPMTEPTFVTRGLATLTVDAGAPLPVKLVDSDGQVVIGRTERPNPQGRVTLQAALADRPADRWTLTVGQTAHRVYAATLPVETVALLRLTLTHDAPQPSPEIELGLEAKAQHWTWRIVPREAAGVDAARYSIEHDTVAVSYAATTPVGDRPGLIFSSDEPIQWRVQPQARFSLWFIRADATRQLLLEQLPIPSPRALRPAVDVYL